MPRRHTQVEAEELVQGELYFFVSLNGAVESFEGQFVGFDQGDNAVLMTTQGPKRYPIQFTAFFRKDNQGPPIITNEIRQLAEQIGHQAPPPLITLPNAATLTSKNFPTGSSNALDMNITNGAIMANFHGEKNLPDPRYYLASSVAQFTARENPFTRQPLSPEQITYYKAKLVGGKKRKSKKTRKAKKTRKQRK
jgi:hypothetical protein